MSRAINNEYIYMPEGVSEFPATPGVTAQDLPKLRPSVAPTPTEQGSTSTKKVRNRDAQAFNEDRARFDGDLGCFITGYTCLTLETVHIINAVRDKTDPNRLLRVVGPTPSRRQLPVMTQPSSFMF